MPQSPNVVSAAFAKKFYGIVVIPPVPTAGAPVVNPLTFTLVAPYTNGKAIGTATASNTPTSWSLSNNAAGWYAISAGGAITLTAAGAAGIGPGTDYIIVNAINASGTGSGYYAIETQ